MARIDAGNVSEGPDETSRRPNADARGGHLGFVAHEIRNPLSTALWTAELLSRMTAEERGGARGEKLSAMCLRSVARVRQLVEDHLMTERLDVGGLPLRIEATGVGEAISAVLEHRPPDAPAVRVDADPALGVDVDRGMLERALESLIAVAGTGGTPVSLAVRGLDSDVVLVTVEGKAADPEGLADPMKGSPSDPTGRALALPLARRIAAALGGTLAAAEGGWRLTLPRARAYTPRPSTAVRP